MPDPFRPTPTAFLSMAGPTPAELEALKASSAQCGHTFAKIESALPGFLARLAERDMKKAYGKSVPVWRPLTRRDDSTYFGRKRRARRARGRRIEARQALVFGHWFRVPFDPSRPSLLELARKVRVMEDEADSLPTRELTIEQWADARRTIQRQQGDAYETDQDDC